MKIALVTPAAAGSRHGNRHTAARWATFLRQLGHRVRMEQTWSGAPADLMIALHARRSHDSARRYKSMYPTRPLIVALTGTDLYRDITFDPDARKSLRIADRLVVLQDEAPKALSSSATIECRSSRTPACGSRGDACHRRACQIWRMGMGPLLARLPRALRRAAITHAALPLTTHGRLLPRGVVVVRPFTRRCHRDASGAKLWRIHEIRRI